MLLQFFKLSICVFRLTICVEFAGNNTRQNDFNHSTLGTALIILPRNGFAFAAAFQAT